MSQTAFDNPFYDAQVGGSLASAAIVLPILFESYRPKSVVDVGCGLAAWLKVAKELGVEQVLGLDGDYVDRSRLLIDRSDFRPTDIAQKIMVERRFDLAISVEVAEHIPYERSQGLVTDLVLFSDVVVFSAALPYQGGTGHVNEQWLEFWAILFRRHGYVACDVLRQRVWGNPKVEFWYRQNLMVFCKQDLATRLFPAEQIASARALSFPHPLMMLINVARYRPLLREARDLECEDYIRLVEAYTSGASEVPPLTMLDAVGKANTRLFPDARTLITDFGTEMREAFADGVRAGLRFRKAEGQVLQSSRIWRIAERVSALLAAVSPTHRRERDTRLITSSGLFDASYYAAQNPNIATSDVDPVMHYVTRGAAERCDPNPLFDSGYYLDQNRDVARAGMNPLAHYIAFGAAEGRKPHPTFDTRYYLAHNPEIRELAINPLAHYLAIGAAEGRLPHG